VNIYLAFGSVNNRQYLRRLRRIIVKYYITLHYITLHYIILYYIILCYIILYYIILYYIILYYIILYYIILYYIILRSSERLASVLVKNVVVRVFLTLLQFAV